MLENTERLDKRRITATGTSSKWSGYPGQRNYYAIKGLNYRSSEVRQLFKEKSSGTIILLKRDRTNTADSNAIAVYSALTQIYNGGYEWTKVGYVDASVAKNEFAGLPDDVILEGTKYGQDSFQLSGKIRKYY